MSHLLNELPTRYLFEDVQTVGYAHLNAGNHLAADKVLTIAIETIHQFYHHLGHEDLGSTEGGFFLMMNTTVDYISEARYGTRLKTRFDICQSGKKTLDYAFSIINQETQDEVARVSIRNLFFDTTLQKPASIPSALIEKINGLRTSGNEIR